jgi:hypothetical protein
VIRTGDRFFLTRREVLSFRAIIDSMPDAADTRSLPPKFTQPQLSLLVKTPPSGPNWAQNSNMTAIASTRG